MRKQPKYEHAALIKTSTETKRATLRIQREGSDWHLYIDDVLWWGPFDRADEAAEFAHYCSRPLPANVGASDPQASIGAPEKLAAWVKVFDP